MPSKNDFGIQYILTLKVPTAFAPFGLGGRVDEQDDVQKKLAKGENLGRPDMSEIETPRI